MNKITKTLKSVGKFFKKNKTTFMVLGGVASAGYGTYSMVKNTPKVIEDIKEAESEKGEPLSFWEKTKVAAPHYATGFIMWVTGNCVIVSGHVLDKKKEASLLSMAALAQHKYQEYRQTNIEENGIEADRKVRRKLAEKEYKRSGRMYAADHADEMIFYEPITDTIFVSTMEDVRNAYEKTLRNFCIKDSEEFIFFLDCLGILTPEMEKRYSGWVWDRYIMEANYGYRSIDMDIIPVKTADGKNNLADIKDDYYIIEFPVEPLSEEALALEYADCGIDDYRSYQEAIELDDAYDERMRKENS